MYYENRALLLKVNERFIVVKNRVAALVTSFPRISTLTFSRSFPLGIPTECSKMFKGRRNSNKAAKFVIIASQVFNNNNSGLCAPCREKSYLLQTQLMTEEGWLSQPVIREWWTGHSAWPEWCSWWWYIDFRPCFENQPREKTIFSSLWESSVRATILNSLVILKWRLSRNPMRQDV